EPERGEGAREQEREGEHDDPEDDVGGNPDAAHRCGSSGKSGTCSGWCLKLTGLVGVGYMLASARRKDQASGKRPESLVTATKPAVMSRLAVSSPRVIEPVSPRAKMSTATATPSSASARTSASGEIFSTSEAPKQW